jgi:hypothetical protein
MTETFSLLKHYYKVALPLSLLTVLYEEIYIPTSYLNKVAKRYFLGAGESAEIFLSLAGGAAMEGRPDLRGKEYHDALTLRVYSSEES